MTTRFEDEDILHLLTGRTPLNLNRFLSQNLKEAGLSLTKEQLSVMAVLWRTDGCSQQVLADATDRGRAGITRLLDNLEKEGLIERHPSQADRRTNLIFLTKKGKVIEKEVVAVVEETISAITKNISDDEIKKLRKIFEKINKNILEIGIHQES